MTSSEVCARAGCKARLSAMVPASSRFRTTFVSLYIFTSLIPARRKIDPCQVSQSAGWYVVDFGRGRPTSPARAYQPASRLPVSRAWDRAVGRDGVLTVFGEVREYYP